MMKKILSLLAHVDTLKLGNHKGEFEVAKVSGVADNQVVRLSWKDENSNSCATVLTEGGLAAANFDAATEQFTVTDYEGEDVVLQMLANGKVLTPDTEPSVFVVVQEGGCSTELYVHSFNRKPAAEAYRKECEEDGSYRTSEPVEVPVSLADHPAFNSFAEQLARATVQVDYPQEA